MKFPSTKNNTLIKVLKYSLLAGLSVFITSHSLTQIITPPKIPQNIGFISPKKTYYQAHKDNYNTLFFGSSRVLNHINPEVIDQVAKSEGLEISSYNFGIPAIREIHSYVLLRDVLQDAPEHLEWVFIEISLDKGYEPIANARTKRSIYWHTFSNTRIAIEYIINSEESAFNKAILISSHILPYIYHQLNIGIISNHLWPSETQSLESQRDQKIYEANKGFLGITSNHYNDLRQLFLADQFDYQKDVKKLINYHKNRTEKDNDLPDNKRILLSKIIDTVHAAGATPFFIITPTLNTAQDLYQAHEEDLIPTLFAYNNPSDYPQFYDAENRHDPEHLNIQTANNFSQELAQDFIQAIKTKNF
ncbi:hypothetical protein N836_36115 [Leptolyngbya sp. Heron Island J]|nr:hypothetical protein N836_36115 [Leptolyngbya sp. Heron Island J]